jgi:hypothetical protein
MTLKWSQLRLLLLESPLFLHSTCVVFLLKSLYIFWIFSASFLIKFLSPEIETSINIHVLCSLSRIIMSGLLLGMVRQFELVNFTVWLRCILDLFLLILGHVRTSAFVQLYPCSLILLLLLLLLLLLQCLAYFHLFLLIIQVTTSTQIIHNQALC